MLKRIPFVYLVVLPACAHAGATGVAVTATDARGQVWLKSITARVEAKEGIFSISDPRYTVRRSSEKSNDAFTNRPGTVWAAADSKRVLDLRYSLRDDGSGRWLMKLICRNRSSQPLHINQIVAIDGFRPGSWAGSRVFDSATGRTEVLRPGRRFGGGPVTAVNRPSITCAFLSTARLSPVVYVTPAANGLRVLAADLVRGMELRPGSELSSETVWISPGSNPSSELDRWAETARRWNANESLPPSLPIWYPTRQSLDSDRDWGSFLALTSRLGMPSPAADRDDTIRRLLPCLKSRGRLVDVWERDMPMVVEHRLQAGEEKWRVVGLFNWKAVPIDIDLNLDRLWDESRYGTPGFLGDPARLGTTDRRYIVYDFWARKYLGEHDGKLRLSLPPGSAKVIVVREWTNHPRILAIGDHIGQGACELLDSAWEGPISALTGTTSGQTRGEDTVVRLYKSSDWKVRSIAVGGKSIFWEEHEHDVVRFHVPDKDGPVSWRVTFDGNAGPGPDKRPMEPGLIVTTVQRP